MSAKGAIADFEAEEARKKDLKGLQKTKKRKDRKRSNLKVSFTDRGFIYLFIYLFLKTLYALLFIVFFSSVAVLEVRLTLCPPRKECLPAQKQNRHKSELMVSTLYLFIS